MRLLTFITSLLVIMMGCDQKQYEREVHLSVVVPKILLEQVKPTPTAQPPTQTVALDADKPIISKEEFTSIKAQINQTIEDKGLIEDIEELLPQYKEIQSIQFKNIRVEDLDKVKAFLQAVLDFKYDKDFLNQKLQLIQELLDESALESWQNENFKTQLGQIKLILDQGDFVQANKKMNIASTDILQTRQVNTSITESP